MNNKKHTVTYNLQFDEALCGRECEGLKFINGKPYCIIFMRELTNRRERVTKRTPCKTYIVRENYMDRYIRCSECLERFGKEKQDIENFEKQVDKMIKVINNVLKILEEK